MFGYYPFEIHHEVIHSILKISGCETYLELGVASGTSFCPAVNIVKRAIGVDVNDNRVSKVGEFHQCTTDEFFENFNENVDVVFIDADHCFESVVKDLENSLKILNKHGIIFLHDTDPIYKELTLEGRCFNTYKIVNYIYQNHPELDMVTLPITIAGLTIVTRKEDRRLLNFMPEDNIFK